MIVGLVPPTAGHINFNGNDVTRLPMFRRARLGMGYLPQEESIFRKLTVEQNLLAILETLPLNRRQRQRTVRRTARTVRHLARGAQPRADAFRRREAPPDHRPLAHHQPEPADARRTVQRR